MKFIQASQTPWHGQKPLPAEINTVHNDPQMAEFELLSVIATLHGVTAFDILIGAEEESEKDRDIGEVLGAFQAFIKPKMPQSNYTGKDVRKK